MPSPADINENMTLHGFTFIEIGDHAFAAWLRGRGWDGKTKKRGTGTFFINEGGKVLAVAIYHSKQPVGRRTWLKTSLV